MKSPIKLVWVILLVLTMAACATEPTRTQKGTAVGAGVGAAVGAGLGQAIGRNTQATVIGAGIGAALGGLAGHQIASYMDRQEQQLRNVAQQSEAVAVQRDQDVLTATFRSDVLFDTDSAVLKPGAWPEIDRVAQVLFNYPQTTIRVEGHTDTRGSEQYNQDLSERRALAVKDALVQRNIDPRRIQTVGYGETMPISDNHALNRRVNIVITPIEAQG
jgi:outer membrane protein OmpA-like peptidoglycan-associated protein